LWSQGKEDESKGRDCTLAEFAKTWDIDLWSGCIEKSHYSLKRRTSSASTT